MIVTARQREEAERCGEHRRRQGVSIRIDHFIRVDLPPRLRAFPGIHNVGHIEGKDGHLLTLVRGDVNPRPRADKRFEGPCIALMQMPNEHTMEVVALLTPKAAGVLALTLRGNLPEEAGPAGLDEAALAESGGFHGWRVGAVVLACPPQRLSAGGHLLGVLKTLDDASILLIRGKDGGISIAFLPDFEAHLSLAATDALAKVLEEFAVAHGIEVSAL